MDRFGVTIFGYLEKGTCGVRGTLKQGEQESSGQYSSLSKQFQIRTSGFKQLFDCKNLTGSSNVITKHVGSILGC
jgi:hypothetical protein